MVSVNCNICSSFILNKVKILGGKKNIDVIHCGEPAELAIHRAEFGDRAELDIHRAELGEPSG